VRRGGGWGKKDETEPLGLGFGHIGKNSRGDRWGEMVGRRVRGSGGSGGASSQNAGREAVGAKKTETEPLGLDFGGRRRKQGRGIVGGGGVVVRMRW
jgi:hypothetical protein